MNAMLWLKTRRQLFSRHFFGHFLKLLIIGINAVKMASVLNHIVENKGTQGSLYGILAYVGSSMCFIKH